MSRFCGLRELQLGHSLLPESAFDRVIDAIRFNTSLKAITIKSCQSFQPEQAVALIQALIATVPTENAFDFSSENKVV